MQNILNLGTYLSPRSSSNFDSIRPKGSTSLKNSGILSPSTPSRITRASGAFESLQQVGQLSSEVERLNEVNCALIIENESLKARLDKSKREQELEARIKILATENERLHSLLQDPRRPEVSPFDERTREFQAEIQAWKEKYAQVEPTIVDLQDRINQLMFEREVDAEEIHKARKETEALKSRLSDALDSILLLTEDNKKLKAATTVRSETSIGAIKNEIRESLGTLGVDAGDREKKLIDAEAKKKMAEELVRLRRDNSEKEKDILNLRDNLNGLEEINRELEFKFTELLNERIEMNKNVQDAQDECQRLAEQNHILEEDNKRIFDVLNNIQMENIQLQGQLRNQINVVRAEDYQRHQSSLSDVQKQKDILTKDLKKAQEDLSKSEEELNKAKEEIKAKNSEVEKLKKNGGGAPVNLETFREKINQLVEELRKTNQVIIDKNTLEGNLKKKIGELEREKLIIIEQFNQRLQQASKELNTFKQDAKVKRQENEALCIEIRRLQGRNVENQPYLIQSPSYRQKSDILKDSSKSTMNESDKKYQSISGNVATQQTKSKQLELNQRGWC